MKFICAYNKISAIEFYSIAEKEDEFFVDCDIKYCAGSELEGEE
jgi:hypothetical protein